jgi:hypothetical protein
MVGSRTKSALLWGLVAGLCFPVLTMGYRIAVGPLPLGIGETLTVAVLLVGIVASIAYVTESRLTPKGRT